MKVTEALQALSFVLVLACALNGCAIYAKCGLDGCAGDAKITADVHSLFEKYPDLGPPKSIQVQTVDHVVYLSGLVSVGTERRTAESVALGAPGVVRVVNSISVSK